MATYGDPSLNQAPPPRAPGDPAERVRKFSPAFFAVMGLCFLLPFVSVTCSGQRVTTIKGIQLVTGGEAEIDPAFEESLQEFETGFNEGFGATPEVPTDAEEVTEEVPLGTDGEDNKIERSIFAIVALVAAALGLILTLVLKGRTRDILAIAMSAVVILGLILLRFDLEGDVEDGEGLVAFQYRYGYWLIVALALIIIALHALGLRRRPGAAPPAFAGGPPPPPPG